MIRKITAIIIFVFLNIYSLYSQSVGLVLSGGGAKGAVHIGIIKALEENEIPIDYIAGTSIGAIVGSLYAMGYSPNQMLALFTSEEFHHWQTGKVEEEYYYYFRKSISTPEFMRFMIPLNDSVDIKNAIMPSSLINPIQMNQAFMGLFSQANTLCGGDFDNLFVPFLCVGSDVYNKKAIVFREGNLGDAVRASMTFPFVFKPLVMDTVFVYDGGIYDNFPVKPMREAFHPDFIIGSAVAGSARKKPTDMGLYEQIESMIMQRTEYEVEPEEGIMMKFKLEDVSLLDFNKSRELFMLGYNRTMELIDSIKGRVGRRVEYSDVSQRRKDFRSHLTKLVFRNVYITGVTSAQQNYIESQLRRDADGTFSMREFKHTYFRLLTDSKIKEIVPHAEYNEDNGTYDLHLNVNIENELQIAFGGNISSMNANQLYLGVGYQSMTDYLANINLDMQVGNTFNGFMLHGRVEFPAKIPLYLRGMIVHNYRKYYESEKLFIDTDLATFIHQRETYGKLALGLPFTSKAKTEMSIGYGTLEDKYFQSNSGPYYDKDFDKSTYNYFQFSSSFIKNTLDAKQYPIVGQKHEVTADFISGSEKYTSAVSGVARDKGFQSWLQLTASINNYQKLSDKFNVGYALEAVLSSKNLLSNYTASILQAPAYTPTTHSQLVFNESFRANQYLAGGITPIWKLSSVVQLRGDFDLFLPVFPIERGDAGTVYYGDLFSKQSYMGELSLVVRLPFMSIGLFGNYYNYPEDNWNFGLNIGYLLFNPKFIR